MNLWNKILSKISSLFKDGTDNHWSSMRFAFLYNVIISNLVFWFVWLGLTIHNNELQSIPESVIIIYCAANGISFAGKYIQKRKE